MATLQRHYRDGEIFGFRCLFEKVGDGVRTRAPYRGAAHSIVVLSGSVAVNAEGEASRILRRDQYCDFDGRKEQHIVALEPSTVVLNLMIFDQPESYKSVPISELHSLLADNHE